MYEAVLKARPKLAAPMAVVPVEIADAEVLAELGVDPEGPDDIDGLLKARAAVKVLPGLVLLNYTGAGPRRRDGVQSVSVKLPPKKG